MFKVEYILHEDLKLAVKNVIQYIVGMPGFRPIQRIERAHDRSWQDSLRVRATAYKVLIPGNI